MSKENYLCLLQQNFRAVSIGEYHMEMSTIKMILNFTIYELYVHYM